MMQRFVPIGRKSKRSKRAHPITDYALKGVLKAAKDVAFLHDKDDALDFHQHRLKPEDRKRAQRMALIRHAMTGEEARKRAPVTLPKLKFLET
jgi:hypothetical protein